MTFTQYPPILHLWHKKLGFHPKIVTPGNIPQVPTNNLPVQPLSTLNVETSVVVCCALSGLCVKMNAEWGGLQTGAKPIRPCRLGKGSITGFPWSPRSYTLRLQGPSATRAWRTALPPWAAEVPVAALDALLADIGAPTTTTAAGGNPPVRRQ